jgi:hypothetical protein
MYGKVWAVTPPGWTGGWRWVAALFGVALSYVTLRALQLASTGLYATLGELLLTFTMNTLLWTWAPWLLLARQIPWRTLLPGGLLMGLCTMATSIASGIYLPRALVSASNQFGALGIAFTYIGWLFVVAFALVCSTVLGAVLARDESRIARLVVGQPGDRVGGAAQLERPDRLQALGLEEEVAIERGGQDGCTDDGAGDRVGGGADVVDADEVGVVQLSDSSGRATKTPLPCRPSTRPSVLRTSMADSIVWLLTL